MNAVRLQPSHPSGALCGRSFTLVELLIVIAILGVLAALLLPALRNSIHLARDVACANNQRQTGSAVHAYADDYRGFLPYNNFTAENLYAGAKTGDKIYGDRPEGANGLGLLFLHSYLTDGRLLACGNEDTPQKQAASLGYGGAVNFAAGKHNSNSQNNTDYWFRCANGYQKNQTESLARIPGDSGLMFCAGKSQYSYVINWYELHQSRGFQLLFADLHGEFYSYALHPTPDLWGGELQYRSDHVKNTFRNAVANLRQ